MAGISAHRQTNMGRGLGADGKSGIFGAVAQVGKSA